MDLYYLDGSQNKQFAVSIKGKAFEIANNGSDVELKPMWKMPTRGAPWLALLVTQGVSRGEVRRATTPRGEKPQKRKAIE